MEATLITFAILGLAQLGFAVYLANIMTTTVKLGKFFLFCPGLATLVLSGIGWFFQILL